MAEEKVEKSKDDKGNLLIDYRQIGATGLRRFSGFIYEDFLVELIGWKGMAVYKEMGDNDSIVGAFLYAIDHICRKVPWRVEPASAAPFDVEAAEFLEQCMDDMDQTWIDTISEILSFIQYGHSLHEIVYKRRCGDGFDPSMRSKFTDGRIGWRGLPIRSQDTLYRWQFDDHGGIQGVQQLAPPHYYNVVIPAEKFLLFRTSTHKNNPEGKSVLRSAYRCFSNDTEILTDSGWILAGDVNKQHKVATLSQMGTIEYQNPSETWSYEHTGEMILAESRFVDQLVTPNHRMWVKRAHKETFEFIEASECNPTVSFKATAEWTATGSDKISIAGHDIDSNVWFQFMGIFLAEGHTSGGRGLGYEVGITQKRGETYDWIKGILAKIPWEFSESDNRGNDVVTFRCYRQELWNELSQYGKAKTKTTPRYILEGSKAQIELFLRAYHLGDGTNAGSYEKYEGTDLIYTSSEAMADDLMEAAFKAGYRPTKRWKEPSGFGGGVWSVVLGKDFSQLRASWQTVDYHGPVHCVTTSNGIVYCRRNGKSSWSGNSWYMKKNIENIEAIGIERDLAGLPLMKVPSEIMSAGASQEQQAICNELKKMITNIRRDEQEGCLIPSDTDANGKPLYELSLLSSGGNRQFDTNKIVQRYDQRIAMAVLADFLMLGHDGAGSLALANSKTNMFARPLGSFLDIIAQVFNNFAVKRLFALNDFQISDYPKIVHGDTENVDLKDIGDYIQKLAQAGMPMFPNEELEKHLLKTAHLPENISSTNDVDQQVEPTHLKKPTSIQEIPDNPVQTPNGSVNDTTPVNGKPPVSTVTNNSGNTESQMRDQPRNKSPNQNTDLKTWGL